MAGSITDRTLLALSQISLESLESEMSVILYGIPNCDTVRKARAWLAEAGVDYAFHDYKKLGIDPELLAQWSERVGWERLLNRAGTTFRKLPEPIRADLDEPRAIALMAAYPSAIRRPIVKHFNGLLVGFDAVQWRVLTNRLNAE